MEQHGCTGETELNLSIMTFHSYEVSLNFNHCPSFPVPWGAIVAITVWTVPIQYS